MAGITAMSSVAAGEANKNEDKIARIELENIIPLEWSQDRKEAVLDLESEFNDLRGKLQCYKRKTSATPRCEAKLCSLGCKW